MLFYVDLNVDTICAELPPLKDYYLLKNVKYISDSVLRKYNCVNDIQKPSCQELAILTYRCTVCLDFLKKGLFQMVSTLKIILTILTTIQILNFAVVIK